MNKRPDSDENSSPSITRRRFLAAAGAAIALPTILPNSVFGQTDRPVPSKRVTVGIVGWGWQGPGNTKALLDVPDCQVVAACDLDQEHLDDAVNTINKKYDNKDCKAYHDYREILARPDIDAVMLAVPDHWHAIIACDAAECKKDIYGEKPLAKTIAEQQAIVKAVQKNKIIWQTGSWQRSTANFHKAAEIVRNGLIGRVTHVEVGLPSGNNDATKLNPSMSEAEPPANLEYETWIGPSQYMPYIPGRLHRNWRWNYNTGGGQLLDWVGHHLDIAHWALDLDASGPYEVEGHGEFPDHNAVWNTCTKYRVAMNYPNGLSITVAGGHPDIKKGTKWIGSNGWVWVDRGAFEASNPEWNDYKTLPEELRKIKLYTSSNHQANFIACVKSRQPAVAPVEAAHHSATPGHLGLISMLTGRRIKWDVKHERIINDDAASQLSTRPFRAPWKLA